MKTVEAFSPQDAQRGQLKEIPQFVLEAVNRLLVERYSPHGDIRIQQDELIELATEIRSTMPHSMKDENFNRSDFFDKGWLNFEPLYEAKGWRVEYDRPSWGDNYEAYFKFSK